MEDEDLYGDLPAAAGPSIDHEKEVEAVLAMGSEAVPSDHVLEQSSGPQYDTVQPAVEPKVESNSLEEVTESQAFARIADALGCNAAEPRQVLVAFSDLVSKAQSAPVKSDEVHRSQIVDKVQIANLMAELLEVRESVAAAAAASQPSVLHLTSLHCDAAVARQFDLLRAANSKLNSENTALRSQVAALQFKPGDAKGRQLVEKLHAAQDECRNLEAQLQARDEGLAQARMHADQVAALQKLLAAQREQCTRLEGQVEDLVTTAASLKKELSGHINIDISIQH